MGRVCSSVVIPYPFRIDDYCLLNRNVLDQEQGYIYCLNFLKRCPKLPDHQSARRRTIPVLCRTNGLYVECLFKANRVVEHVISSG